MPLLHEIDDFSDLIAVVADARGIDPGLVEKDYWIMNALWGLQQLGFRFELKGGTSLSKGFKLIHRFSEDIDILIHPDGDLPVGRNHTKSAHVAQRQAFFDGLVDRLPIPGFIAAERDPEFDDPSGQMRGAEIRLRYPEINPLPEGVKTGILLEAGFDQVTPNRPCVITSWAWDQAAAAGVEGLIDSRALDVPCYEPGYTFVEKLQTVSTKYRQQQERGTMPNNFLRHYYDLYGLLEDESVQAFIGTSAYFEHKARRFRQADQPDLRQNPSFLLNAPGVRETYEAAYERTRALYYEDRPSLSEILERLDVWLDRL